jgi:hypothetical protein
MNGSERGDLALANADRTLICACDLLGAQVIALTPAHPTSAGHN